MRTNIEIDDVLMKKALEVSGAATKKAAVEQGLEMLIRSEGRRAIFDLAGKVEFWEDDDPKALSMAVCGEAESRSNKSAARVKSAPSRRKRAA